MQENGIKSGLGESFKNSGLWIILKIMGCKSCCSELENTYIVNEGSIKRTVAMLWNLKRRTKKALNNRFKS